MASASFVNTQTFLKLYTYSLTIKLFISVPKMQF